MSSEPSNSLAAAVLNLAISASPKPAACQKRSGYLSWDEYFMATALLAAKRSKDPVTQVGACIVDEDHRIVAIGYNGFPRHCSDDVFSWGKVNKNKTPAADPLDDKRMYVVHAEANAILNKNTASLNNSRLYATLFPCNECAKLIIQAGIKEVLYLSDKYSEKPSYQAAKRMFDAASVHYKRFVPCERTLVLDFYPEDNGSDPVVEQLVD